MTNEERRAFWDTAGAKYAIIEKRLDINTGYYYLFDAVKRLVKQLKELDPHDPEAPLSWIKKTGAAWLDVVEEAAILGDFLSPRLAWVRTYFHDLAFGWQGTQATAGLLWGMGTMEMRTNAWGKLEYKSPLWRNIPQVKEAYKKYQSSAAAAQKIKYQIIENIKLRVGELRQIFITFRQRKGGASESWARTEWSEYFVKNYL